MVDLVLFPSILGLRPVETRIAAVFEAAGHRVTIPELYAGETATDYDAGFTLLDRIGDALILARACEALEDLPPDTVLAGVSFGASLVGSLWGERPRAKGALLFAGVAPWMQPPRPGFRVQAHVARPDPFDDEHYFADWLAAAGKADAVLHRYDSAGHYFLDETLPDYDAKAAKLCLDRSLAFLGSL